MSENKVSGTPDNAAQRCERLSGTGGANFGLLEGGVTFISETICATVFQELIRGTAKERP